MWGSLVFGFHFPCRKVEDWEQKLMNEVFLAVKFFKQNRRSFKKVLGLFFFFFLFLFPVYQMKITLKITFQVPLKTLCILPYKFDQLNINTYFGNRYIHDCSISFTYLCRDFMCIYLVSADKVFTKFKQKFIFHKHIVFHFFTKTQ